MMLRDYQQEMIDRLQRAWQRHRSVMVQMPTGTGKTVLLAEIIAHPRPLPKEGESGVSPDASSEGRKWEQKDRVLIVAHRRELIEQISETLDGFGVEHGLIVSGQPVDVTKRVQVASIQTLTRRATTHQTTPPDLGGEYSLVIIDEAHHALAKTYRMLWNWWPEARFLGLTATPCRLNGATFTDLFDTLLQSWTIQEFIDKGWLSDFDYVSASPGSEELRRVASLTKRGMDGDYQTKELATVMDCPESIAHLYKSYEQFAYGKKGIVYAINREHARHIAEYYGQQGVRCAVIDSKTAAEERKRIVEKYKAGSSSEERSASAVDVLINVDIFSEGFDCPEVEFIQLARPTLSLNKYLQQVGRGMRISEGKEAVLILDQVGLYQMFGLPTEERDWWLLFIGKLPGKGSQGMAHPIIIKEDMAHEKELVNLQMVRIRRRSESLEGLAVYLQNGKYGVMKDGKMTTQPVFERIRRSDHALYYALATYPYDFYKNRTTVIDLQGIDQQVQLYGQVEFNGDFLCGKDVRGDRMLWDTVGKKYYKGQTPKFERIGGLDVLRNTKGQYELRYTRGLQTFQFSRDEVFFNSYIAIIRNVLIMKRDDFRMFKIFGYQKDSVLVCAKKQHESIQVTWDGRIGKHYDSIPNGFSFEPSIQSLRLKWAE